MEWTTSLNCLALRTKAIHHGFFIDVSAIGRPPMRFQGRCFMAAAASDDLCAMMPTLLSRN